MYGGTISGNTARDGGGGVYSSYEIFKKLPPIGGGQNSGIIYGYEATGVDENGLPLRNTGSSPAIYINGAGLRRDTTAWETDHIDSETGRGLSANGNPPFGQ